MKSSTCFVALAWLLYNIQASAAERFIKIKTAEMTSKGSILTKIPQQLQWRSSQRKEYKILNGGEYTEVTKYSGILKVKKEMDRENLCIDNREHCMMQIQVAAWPVNQRAKLQMVNIEIEILDVNDNAPVFVNKVIKKSMSEAVRVETTIRLDSAVDPDYGANSIQDYRITAKGGSNSINSYFALETIINFDGTKIPELRLRRHLDRERKGVHELTLEAIDGGTPALTGSATVLINITDSNDNSPKFEKDSYKVYINEHVEEGTEVIKVYMAQI